MCIRRGLKIIRELFKGGNSVDKVLKGDDAVFGLDISTNSEFIQPVLTKNGTVGGSDFAVTASSYYNHPDTYIYHATNPDTTGIQRWQSNNGSGLPQSLIYYNPTPIKLKGFIMERFGPEYAPKEFTISGSNDGSNYTELYATEDSGFATLEMIFKYVTTNDFYKYFKLTITKNVQNQDPTMVRYWRLIGDIASSGGSGGGGSGGGGEPVDDPNMLMSINENDTIHLKSGTYLVKKVQANTYENMTLSETDFKVRGINQNDKQSATPFYSQAEFNSYCDMYIELEYDEAIMTFTKIAIGDESVLDPSTCTFIGRINYSEQYDKYYISDKTE